MTSTLLSSYPTPLRAVVLGANGGLGSAFVRALAERAQVYALARTAPVVGGSVVPITCDPLDETSLAAAAAQLRADGPVHLVIVTTGYLSSAPEKSWRHLDAAKLAKFFAINSIAPALAAKHLLPLLPRQGKSAFAALSARVGSISDNQSGGWHGYRAAKAALNMLLKNFAIELARTHPDALCVGLHPGTVDTAMSKPFQANVPAHKLFTPDQSAAYLLRVLDQLSAQDSGNVFAWDGARIPA
jgi:NAD(P)-dependent dehydrogenase (short-subunit alcohol dehydrogenase family)